MLTDKYYVVRFDTLEIPNAELFFELVIVYKKIINILILSFLFNFLNDEFDS